MTCTWVGDVGNASTSASPTPTARRKRACGRSARTATATPAPRPTSWARRRARPPATRCAGTTCSTRSATDGGTIHLDMDDWMWLLDDEDRSMNRTTFSKFGITLRRGHDLLPQTLGDRGGPHGPESADSRLEGPPLLDHRRLHRHRRRARATSSPRRAPAWRCRRGAPSRSRRWPRAIRPGTALALPLDINDAPALAKRAAAKLGKALGRHRPRGADGGRLQAHARVGARPRGRARDGRDEPAWATSTRSRAVIPRLVKQGSRHDRARLHAWPASAGCPRAWSTAPPRRR